ncbi:putative Zinc finger, RING-type [Septoria linicola]|nr:putative Zinc finger, RING-type [Septoria linicola]
MASHYFVVPVPPEYLPWHTISMLKDPAQKEQYFITDQARHYEPCPICFQDLNPSDTTVEPLPGLNDPTQDRLILEHDRCPHVLHAGCFHTIRRNIVGNQNFCPLCRKMWFAYERDFQVLQRLSAILAQVKMGFLGDETQVDGAQPVVVMEDDLILSFVSTAYAIKQKQSVAAAVMKFTRWEDGIVAHQDGRKIVNLLVANVKHLAGLLLTFRQLQSGLRTMVLSGLGQQIGEMDAEHNGEATRFVDEILLAGIMMWYQRFFAVGH